MKRHELDHQAFLLRQKCHGYPDTAMSLMIWHDALSYLRCQQNGYAVAGKEQIREHCLHPSSDEADIPVPIGPVQPPPAKMQESRGSYIPSAPAVPLPPPNLDDRRVQMEREQLGCVLRSIPDNTEEKPHSAHKEWSDAFVIVGVIWAAAWVIVHLAKG